MATYKAGQVSIDLQADSAKLSRALSDAERKVKSSFSKMQKQSKDLTKSMGNLTGKFSSMATVIAGLTAPMAALTRQSLDMTRKLKSAAEIAGVSVSKFQGMSLAVKTVGIDTDKFGDILADTEEKIGEFIATGGGGFQDFADVMGYSDEQALAFAKSVQGLSGDQVLGKMVEAMEAAGVSTEGMNFALEGMASDSRKLLPLLVNQGAELDKLSNKYSNMATVITDETVDSLSKLDTSMTIAANNMSNAFASALAAIAPLLQEAAENTAFFYASLQKGTSQNLLSRMADLSDKQKELNTQAQYYANMHPDTIILSMANGLTTAGEEAKYYTDQLEKANQEHAKLAQQYKVINGLTLPDPTGGGSGGSTGGGSGSGGVSTGSPTVSPMSDPTAGIPDFSNYVNAYAAMATHTAAILDQFNIDSAEALKLRHEADLAMIKQYVDQGVLTVQQGEQAKLAATQERAMAEMQLEWAKYDGFGQALDAYSEQSETAAIAAFAFNQGKALSETIMAQSQAIAQVWADPAIPTWSKAAQSAAAGAAVLAQIQNIKSQAIGQFHDGGEIPRDGTFFMEQGEMVIPQDRVSDFINAAGSGGAQYTINAPINLPNGAIVNEEVFGKQLMKQRAVITAAIKKTERENPNSRRR